MCIRDSRVVVVLVSTVAIFGTYRTLNGIEAGTAFLVLMAAAKLLETRTSRDLTVIVFIGWFLLYAALLREQSLSQLPWLLGSAFLTAVALMRVHASSAQAPAGHIVRRTLRLLLLAAPLALLLFLLFPRLPGPFWGIDSRTEARTGLDDEMTPGDVSDLSASGEVAFRVRFFGATPPPEQRYWRGPVLWAFDGQEWSLADRYRATLPLVPNFEPASVVDYEVLMEPTEQSWWFPLDVVLSAPADSQITGDGQVVSRRPLIGPRRARFQSAWRYQLDIDVVPEQDVLVGDTREAFVRQIQRLMQDPALRRRLSVNGRAFVERRFSWDVIGHQLEGAFRDAVASRHRRQ